MSDTNKISGKIVNYNSSFDGTIFFDHKIQSIENNLNYQYSV